MRFKLLIAILLLITPALIYASFRGKSQVELTNTDTSVDVPVTPSSTVVSNSLPDPPELIDPLDTVNNDAPTFAHVESVLLRNDATEQSAIAEVQLRRRWLDSHAQNEPEYAARAFELRSFISEIISRWPHTTELAKLRYLALLAAEGGSPSVQSGAELWQYALLHAKSNFGDTAPSIALKELQRVYNERKPRYVLAYGAAIVSNAPETIEASRAEYFMGKCYQIFLKNSISARCHFAAAVKTSDESARIEAKIALLYFELSLLQNENIVKAADMLLDEKSLSRENVGTVLKHRSFANDRLKRYDAALQDLQRIKREFPELSLASDVAEFDRELKKKIFAQELKH
jgi:hypothetical protein